MVEPVELEIDDSPHIGGEVDVDCDDVADQQDDTQPVLRRSERARHRPDYYAEGAYIAAVGVEEPSFYRKP